MGFPPTRTQVESTSQSSKSLSLCCFSPSTSPTESMQNADLKNIADDAEPPKAEDAEQVNEAANEKKEVDDENENDDDEEDNDEGMPCIILLQKIASLESPHENDMGARMVPRFDAYECFMSIRLHRVHARAPIAVVHAPW